MKTKVDALVAIDYPVVVERDPETRAYLVSVRDWPGCMSDGVTIQEALANLQEAKRRWVAKCFEKKLPIPPPQSAETYSGRFNARVPRSLHRRLVEQAAHDGVSLNTFVIAALTEVVTNARIHRLPPEADLRPKAERIRRKGERADPNATMAEMPRRNSAVHRSPQELTGGGDARLGRKRGALPHASAPGASKRRS
jgi:antitoxin HicB